MKNTYKYGLLSPTKNADVVEDQLSKAHSYFNKIIELDREKRNKIRELIDNNPDILFLTKECEIIQTNYNQLEEQAKQYRQDNSTKTILKQLKTEISKARKIMFDKYKELYSKRRTFQTENKEKISSFEESFIEERNQFRKIKNSGVYSGTAAIITDAADKARKVPLYKGINPKNSKFKRWTGEGSVGVKIQDGFTNEQIFSENTLVYIEYNNLSGKKDPKSKRSEKNKYCTLHVRIASDDKGHPVFAEFPMIMHRPFPEGCSINNVKITKCKIGADIKWEAHFSIKHKQENAKQENTGKVLAYDPGWRQMPDGSGYRMAYYKDSSGNKLETKLPSELMKRFEKIDDLKSIRKKNFNQIKEEFIVWLNENECPDWLKEKTKTISKWESQARLAGLVKFWKNNRFGGDEEVYNKLEEWRYHDFHLWQWETHLSSKAQGWRNEIYKVEAAKLAKQYDILVSEDSNIAEMKKNKTVDKDENKNETAKKNLQMLAPGMLRNYLYNTFRSKEVNLVPALNSSKKCNNCDSIEKIGDSLIHTCSKCGKTYDRDENACDNHLSNFLNGNFEKLEFEKQLKEGEKSLSEKMLEGRRAKLEKKCQEKLAASNSKIARDDVVEKTL